MKSSLFKLSVEHDYSEKSKTFLVNVFDSSAPDFTLQMSVGLMYAFDVGPY